MAEWKNVFSSSHDLPQNGQEVWIVTKCHPKPIKRVYKGKGVFEPGPLYIRDILYWFDEEEQNKNIHIKTQEESELEQIKKSLKRLEDFCAKDGGDLGFLANKVLKLYKLTGFDYKSETSLTLLPKKCSDFGIEGARCEKNCLCKQNLNIQFSDIILTKKGHELLLTSQNNSTFEQLWDLFVNEIGKLPIHYQRTKDKILEILENHNKKLIN